MCQNENNKSMEGKYQFRLQCATCGSEDQFEFNEDKSYVRCGFCNREYRGGIEELKELNQNAFNALKEEIRNDVAANIKKELLKALGEIKNK